MLIDLGDEWELPTEPENPHWTKGLRPLAMVVALLPALALAAAAPRSEPALVITASISMDSTAELIEFTGKELVVHSRRLVTVYEPDGRERWHVTLNNLQEVYLRVDLAQQRVLAMAQRQQRPHTVAFDITSGARVWEFNGWADTFEGVVFVTSLEGSDFAVYDAVTLAERWSARGVAAQHIDLEAHTVLSMDRDGTINERRMTTGEVVRSGRLELPAARNYGLGVADDIITVFYSRDLDDESQMSTFDRQTFAPRPAARPRFLHSERFDCGPVVCEMEDFGGQMSVLDKTTGALLWQPRPDAGLMYTPAGLFSFPHFSSSERPALQILDPFTGRQLASLDGWRTITTDGRNISAPVVLRQVNAVGTEGRTFIGGFERSGLRVLGSVPHVMYRCRYADWVLACATADRHLIVVEINSGRWRA